MKLDQVEQNLYTIYQQIEELREILNTHSEQIEVLKVKLKEVNEDEPD